jgi:hypothetical protein
VREHVKIKWDDHWGLDPALRLAAVGSSDVAAAVESAKRLVERGQQGLIEDAAEVYGVSVPRLEKDLAAANYYGPLLYLQKGHALWEQLTLFITQKKKALRQDARCAELHEHVKLHYHHLPVSNAGAERNVKRFKNLPASQRGPNRERCTEKMLTLDIQSPKFEPTRQELKVVRAQLRSEADERRAVGGAPARANLSELIDNLAPATIRQMLREEEATEIVEEKMHYGKLWCLVG